MLELDDIQGLTVRGYNLPVGRYIFLQITDAGKAQQWLAQIAAEITNATPRPDKLPACVNVAFSYNGLRALGLPQPSLDTFADEFRQGIVQRAEMLGDTGSSSPEHWEGGFGTEQMHVMFMLFAQDLGSLEALSSRHRALLEQSGGTSELSFQDVQALPGIKEHFGYRDGISRVLIEGSQQEPMPHEVAIKPGEFVLGYPDQLGDMPPFPQPEMLGRNGSYLVYRKLHQDVAAFRRFLHEQVGSDEQVEWIAAKLMGRWRSGAPLVLAPNGDDLVLAEDSQRNADFNYAAMDARGLACPIGAHIRRVNPRDTQPEIERTRHLLVRRGLPYGPPLPEGAPDDGADRGVAGVLVNASLARQFEFVQRVWINNKKFDGLENDKDPIVGDNDGTYDHTIQAWPVRKRLHGLPRFVTVKGGEYFFLPGIKALRFIAAGSTT
ncbi:MAG: Dyp-type peroxidase [Herpetosiphonaceae bacterium]|nr:Dyp-type peroxidase [Herpetosiphonaceae bacterium]